MIFSSALDYEIKTLVNRIVNLSQLTPFSKIKILLQGVSSIRSANCSNTGLLSAQESEFTRCQIVQEIETMLISIILEVSLTDYSVAILVNEYASYPFQKRLIRSCIDKKNTTLLFQMKEDVLEEALSKTNHTLLHQYYCTHSLYLKAAKYYLSLWSGTNPLSLTERREILLQCIEDMKSMEKAGQLERIPRMLTQDILQDAFRILNYQIKMNDSSNTIRSRDSLVQALKDTHRFDLLLLFMKEEGMVDMKEVNSIWLSYLTFMVDHNDFSSLQGLLSSLKETSLIPLNQVLVVCLMYASEEMSQSIILFCLSKAIGKTSDISNALKSVYDSDRSELMKLHIAGIVLR